MSTLASHEVETLRRSVVMVPPGQPCGLSRDKVLEVIEQLQEVTDERDRLMEELVGLGFTCADSAVVSDFTERQQENLPTVRT